MTGTDLGVNVATSVPVIFEPPCICRPYFKKEENFSVTSYNKSQRDALFLKFI